MRALIFHKPNSIVDRLIKELVQANKNIQFSETANFKDALEVFIIYKPEIIILDVEQHAGFENEFLQFIKNYNTDIKEISLSNHPFTKIILINFTKAELEVEKILIFQKQDYFVYI